MNQLAHACITYVVLSFFFTVSDYLIPIVVFSIILDVDHLPGYMKILFMSKQHKKKLKIEDYVDLFRTTIQEPIGILTIEVLLGLLWLFGLRHEVILIAGASIFLHWLIDFLTVHTRPFDPLNKKMVCLFFNSKTQRVYSEVVITVVSIVVFLFVFFG